MTSLTDTQVVTASGGLVELASVTATSDSATVAAGSNAVVIGPITAVCDGNPVVVEFHTARLDTGASGGGAYFTLEVDGVSQGRISEQSAGNAAITHHAEARVTPSAGSHTFQIRMYPVTSAAAFRATTATWAVGTSFLRVSKIVQATQWPAVTTGTIICTSTTRPAIPFEGQTIYETDTDKQLIWNGSGWYPPWNQPWGFLGESSLSASFSGTTTVSDTGLSINVPLVAGRNYRYQLYGEMSSVTANHWINFELTDGSNNRLARAQQKMLDAGVAQAFFVHHVEYASSTGTAVRKVRAGGGATFLLSMTAGTRPVRFTVEDIGPA